MIKFKKRGIITILTGVLLGYAYYYFIGCNGGSCPITSNPYLSALYGGLIGLALAIPSGKKRGSGDGEKDN